MNIIASACVLQPSVIQSYTQETVVRCVIIAPLNLIASRFGKMLFLSVPTTWFNKAAYSLLLASSTMTLLA